MSHPISPPAPWLDLPPPLTEKILERLVLPDYIRFAAVCRHWRSIQMDHRRRHAPLPPPMLNLPWLLRDCKSESDQEAEAEAMSFYSPFEDRFYRIPISDHPIKPYLQPLSHGGWLLRSDAITNPISGSRIPFPQPLDSRFFPQRYIAAACAAVSPPPHCVAFVVGTECGELLLCRPGTHPCGWTLLQLPLETYQRVSKAVAFGGKLYCVTHFSRFDGYEADTHFIVVDPMLTPPAFLFYPMGGWGKVLREEEKRGLRSRELQWELSPWLVELDGEVLLVREIVKRKTTTTVGFLLLKPDLPKGISHADPSERRRRWTRVGSLGGRLLLIHRTHAVALSAADVGLRGNCIYFSSSLKLEMYSSFMSLEDMAPWKVFDVGAETVTEVPFPSASLVEKYAQDLFMPSLC